MTPKGSAPKINMPLHFGVRVCVCVFGVGAQFNGQIENNWIPININIISLD